MGIKASVLVQKLPELAHGWGEPESETTRKDLVESSIAIQNGFKFKEAFPFVKTSLGQRSHREENEQGRRLFQFGRKKVQLEPSILAAVTLQHSLFQTLKHLDALLKLLTRLCGSEGKVRLSFSIGENRGKRKIHFEKHKDDSTTNGVLFYRWRKAGNIRRMALRVFELILEYSKGCFSFTREEDTVVLEIGQRRVTGNVKNLLAIVIPFLSEVPFPEGLISRCSLLPQHRRAFVPNQHHITCTLPKAVLSEAEARKLFPECELFCAEPDFPFGSFLFSVTGSGVLSLLPPRSLPPRVSPARERGSNSRGQLKPFVKTFAASRSLPGGRFNALVENDEDELIEEDLPKSSPRFNSDDCEEKSRKIKGAGDHITTPEIGFTVNSDDQRRLLFFTKAFDFGTRAWRNSCVHLRKWFFKSRNIAWQRVTNHETLSLVAPLRDLCTALVDSLRRRVSDSENESTDVDDNESLEGQEEDEAESRDTEDLEDFLPADVSIRLDRTADLSARFKAIACSVKRTPALWGIFVTPALNWNFRYDKKRKGTVADQRNSYVKNKRRTLQREIENNLDGLCHLIHLARGFAPEEPLSVLSQNQRLAYLQACEQLSQEKDVTSNEEAVQELSNVLASLREGFRLPTEAPSLPYTSVQLEIPEMVPLPCDGLVTNVLERHVIRSSGKPVGSQIAFTFPRYPVNQLRAVAELSMVFTHSLERTSKEWIKQIERLSCVGSMMRTGGNSISLVNLVKFLCLEALSTGARQLPGFELNETRYGYSAQIPNYLKNNISPSFAKVKEGTTRAVTTPMRFGPVPVKKMTSGPNPRFWDGFSKVCGEKAFVTAEALIEDAKKRNKGDAAIMIHIREIDVQLAASNTERSLLVFPKPLELVLPRSCAKDAIKTFSISLPRYRENPAWKLSMTLKCEDKGSQRVDQKWRRTARKALQSKRKEYLTGLATKSESILDGVVQSPKRNEQLWQDFEKLMPCCGESWHSFRARCSEIVKRIAKHESGYLPEQWRVTENDNLPEGTKREAVQGSLTLNERERKRRRLNEHLSSSSEQHCVQNGGVEQDTERRQAPSSLNAERQRYRRLLKKLNWRLLLRFESWVADNKYVLHTPFHPPSDMRFGRHNLTLAEMGLSGWEKFILVRRLEPVDLEKLVELQQKAGFEKDTVIASSDVGADTILSIYIPMHSLAIEVLPYRGKILAGKTAKCKKKTQSKLAKAKKEAGEVPTKIQAERIQLLENNFQKLSSKLPRRRTADYKSLARFIANLCDVFIMADLATNSKSKMKGINTVMRRAAPDELRKHLCRHSSGMLARFHTMLHEREDFSSKLCGKCGIRNDKLGANKKARCSYCGLVELRDCGAARKILLKFLFQRKLENDQVETARTQYNTKVQQNPPMLYRREEQMQTTNCPASFQAGLRSPLDPKK